MTDLAKLQKLAAECRRLQQEIEETIASIPDNVLGELDMPSVLAAIELAGDALNSLAETEESETCGSLVQAFQELSDLIGDAIDEAGIEARND